MSLHATPSCKLILLGNGSVGKSSIVSRLLENDFIRVYKQTIGVDFYERLLLYPRNQSVLLQVWDIGGQNIDSKMLSKYVYGSDVAFLCYDVTDAQSFGDVNDWFALIEKNVAVYLIGDKSDLIGNRVISEAKHIQFVEKFGLCGGFCMSARNGDTVLRCVYTAVAQAKTIRISTEELSMYESIVNANSIQLSRDDEPRTKFADEIEEEDRRAKERRDVRDRFACIPSICSIL